MPFQCSNQKIHARRLYRKLEVKFEESYAVESGAHRCIGISIRQNGLAEYLTGRVRNRYYGLDTISEIVEKFPDLRATGFGNDGLVKMRPNPKPWEVGESFSECFLEDHKGARLPYPAWQDLKNQNTSSTGADLVGYDCQSGSTVFLFGEVKTSAHTRNPPSVVKDLTRQLQDLGSSKKSFQLVYWLGLKAKTQKDSQDFSQAIKSYVKNIFKVVGVLIRDTVPNRRDLEGAFTHLVYVLRHTITLEMLAIYLPVAIDKIPQMMDGESGHE